jgi:hypothetical protein
MNCLLLVVDNDPFAQITGTNYRHTSASSLGKDNASGSDFRVRFEHAPTFRILAASELAGVVA